jgi:putative transposase
MDVPPPLSRAMFAWWRTVKYEEVYMHRYESVPQLANGLKRYFSYYNEECLHQSLGYRTPSAVYREGRGSAC